MIILLSCKKEAVTNYDRQIDKVTSKTDTKSFLKVLSEKYFSLICHQDHSILMSVKGEVIPLCPRCMGLHIGFTIAVIILMITVKNRIKISGSFSFIILTASLGLMVIEWTFAQFTIYQSTILSRLLTGLVAGSIFGLLFTIYKKGFTRSVYSGQTIINASRIVCLISMSIIGGVVIILSNNWTVIDISLLISVTANFILIIHTIMLRFKPFSQVLIIKN
jgi:uncharacterized membrane protein